MERLTEATLVDAICEAIASARAPQGRVALGIGDDAAAWQPSRSHLAVVTSDALVDGVHFLRERMTATAVGARAMAANLSDVAAMGARARIATVVLHADGALTRAWVSEAYREMARLCASFGASIVGGDIVRSPVLALSITIVGEVSRGRLKRRDGGRAGDVLAVTGTLGASRAGLELLRRDLDVPADVRARASAAFEAPVPRVREGAFLAASANVRAMMDLSDGLSLDASRLALASGCGYTLDALPVDEAAVAVAAAAGDDAESYALDGGEDFELLVAVAPRAFDHLAARFFARFRRPLRRVGVLDERPGARRVDAAGARDLAVRGYDHFATAPR